MIYILLNDKLNDKIILFDKNVVKINSKFVCRVGIRRISSVYLIEVLAVSLKHPSPNQSIIVFFIWRQ